MAHPSNPTVLVVEDEPPQAQMVVYNLKHNGFNVEVAEDGEAAYEKALELLPDLIILDWMLPKLSGIEVCRRLRQNPDMKEVPIIMLTARGEEEDRVRGLDCGADDYVVKPFLPSELIARLRALLRRARPAFAQETLEYKDLVLDLTRHKALRNGVEIHLGPTEFRLLAALLERPGRVLSREQLLDLAWGRNIYVEDRTVDVHIRRLRKALNAENGEDVIRTVRGVGYSVD